MNKLILSFSIVAFSLLLFSCKNDVSTSGSNNETKVTTEQKAASPAIIALRERAKSVYDFRMADGKPNVAQILDHGVWEYKFTFADQKMSELGALAGKWIDFAPDNTYEYGWYDDVQGSGIYHYDSENSIALLIDNDPTAKPQEFEMKLVMSALVMIGTKTYNDNSTQSKLDNREVRPVK